MQCCFITGTLCLRRWKADCPGQAASRHAPRDLFPNDEGSAQESPTHEPGIPFDPSGREDHGAQCPHKHPPSDHKSSQAVKTTDAQPKLTWEFFSLVRDFTSIVRESSSVVRESSSVVREFGSVVREFGSVVRDFHSLVSPRASVASPGASVASPGASVASPRASVASPRASVTSPGAGLVSLRGSLTCLTPELLVLAPPLPRERKTETSPGASLATSRI